MGAGTDGRAYIVRYNPWQNVSYPGQDLIIFLCNSTAHMRE